MQLHVGGGLHLQIHRAHTLCSLQPVHYNRQLGKLFFRVECLFVAVFPACERPEQVLKLSAHGGRQVGVCGARVHDRALARAEAARIPAYARRTAGSVTLHTGAHQHVQQLHGVPALGLDHRGEEDSAITRPVPLHRLLRQPSSGGGMQGGVHAAQCHHAPASAEAEGEHLCLRHSSGMQLQANNKSV